MKKSILSLLCMGALSVALLTGCTPADSEDANAAAGDAASMQKEDAASSSYETEAASGGSAPK